MAQHHALAAAIFALVSHAANSTLLRKNAREQQNARY
jgi:hypothetical protein